MGEHSDHAVGAGIPASTRFEGDIDRRALMQLPIDERREILRAQAEECADEYNRTLDHEWLDANLGEFEE